MTQQRQLTAKDRVNVLVAETVAIVQEASLGADPGVFANTLNSLVSIASLEFDDASSAAFVKRIAKAMEEYQQTKGTEDSPLYEDTQSRPIVYKSMADLHTVYRDVLKKLRGSGLA